jgi:hypothetical protein
MGGKYEMDLQVVEWGMDWTDLVQDGNRWCALVSTVMKGLHKMRGIYRLTENKLASLEGLCSTELVSKLVS